MANALDLADTVYDAGMSAEEYKNWLAYVAQQATVHANLVFPQVYDTVVKAISAQFPDIGDKKLRTLADDLARKQAGTMITGFVDTELNKIGSVIADGLARKAARSSAP